MDKDHLKEDEEVRIFTEKQFLDKESKVIENILLHFIKLKFRLNYDQDRDKHCREMVGLSYKMKSRIDKDPHMQKSEPEIRYKSVMTRYDRDYWEDKVLSKWESELRSKYGYKGDLEKEDYLYCKDLLSSVLEKKNVEEMHELLLKVFPAAEYLNKTFSKSYESVAIRNKARELAFRTNRF